MLTYMLKAVWNITLVKIWLCDLSSYNHSLAWDWKQCLQTLMCRFYMSLQTSLRCCLIITIKTKMFNTLMYSLYVPIQTSFLCWLVVTMRTSMFNTIMNRFMWVFKFSLCVAWWSQCGQEYLLSSCNDSICVIKHPFLVVC